MITPFFMGTVVGAIASGRVPVGNAEGDPWSSWLNPVSILVGVLFVATGAYLAAVFLITDARRAGDDDLVDYFRRRAYRDGDRHRGDRRWSGSSTCTPTRATSTTASPPTACRS